MKLPLHLPPSTLHLIIIIGVLLLCSCTTDDSVSSPEQLVVEGWIDDGGFPQVILTTSLPIDKEPRSTSDIDEHLLRWARVTVSDEDTTVVLTGMYDKDYFPPFVYTTGNLRGRAGHTYRLTVDWLDYHATATTTIPEPVAVDSFVVERTTGTDSLACTIKACFTDRPGAGDYYKIFVYRNGSFRSPYLSTVSDETFADGQQVMVDVYRPIDINDEDHHVDFFIDDDVYVKFAHIDAASYRFWKDHDEAVTMGRNPLFPVTTNLRGNVEGALGCWCGYGARFYHILPKRSIKTE